MLSSQVSNILNVLIIPRLLLAIYLKLKIIFFLLKKIVGNHLFTPSLLESLTKNVFVLI